MPRLLSTATRPTRALAALATLLAATATASAARAARRELAAPTLADAILAALRPAPAPRGPAAYVVLRPADCTGNLDFLAIFERDGVRDHIPLAAAIAVGTRSADVTTLRATLAARGLRLPVAPADPPLARALRVLGHRSTPYILVLDARGALAYAADAPATFADLQRVAGTVRRLADDQPPATTP